MRTRDPFARALLAASALGALTLAACTSEPSDELVSLTLAVGDDGVEVLETASHRGQLPALPEGGPLAVRITDEASGERLLEAGFGDPRLEVGELDTPEPGEATSLVRAETAPLVLTTPRPPSGRGQLEIDIPTADGGTTTRSVAFDAVPSERAPARAGLTDADAEGVAGARAPLGEVCPEEYWYWQWPGEEGSEERQAYHGCGDMRFLGGNEDPSDSLLIVLLPMSGWSGDVSGFLDAAQQLASEALIQNQWGTDHADHLSFYALYDESVADNATGGCDVGSTASLAAQQGVRQRVLGAEMGPLGRGHGVEPDIWVGVLNNGPRSKCNGYASDATRRGEVGDPTAEGFITAPIYVGCNETDESVFDVDCSAGVRLVHEMGHALGGLADEYGGSISGYPNYEFRSRASWRCLVGDSPQLICPDHAPPAEPSFVRFVGPDPVRPCSDSLMRGWYSGMTEFDPVSYAAMTNALAGEIGASLDGGLDACGEDDEPGECEPADCADCGRDGCGGTCECSCTTEGSDSCVTALGSMVCVDRTTCAKTADLAPSGPGACRDLVRSETVYVRATCSRLGHWRAEDCAYYREIERCLGGIAP
ncbi:MAG TPA: hypothetical protein RMH99_04665 [Sandaracinaceae bacterium LLY-WYZ-13_1]|nr:hypothetical protein [Sandaracinaceae bacterium LLY-WYZ-13_1]